MNLVCTYEKGSPLYTISEQQPAYSYLSTKILEYHYPSVVSECHTLTIVTDQSKTPMSSCADLHCKTSGVPLSITTPVEVVWHSSPGNYLSMACKSKDVNSETLVSNAFCTAKEKHLISPSCPFRSSCSLLDPQSLSSSAYLKLTGCLLGSSCLYRANAC